MSEYHTSVLLDESVSALIGTQTNGVYADATFGGGGHTAEILSRLSKNGSVLAFDRDLDAIGNRINDPRLTLIRSDFRWIHNHVLNQGHKEGIDGVLADLGVSSHQFDTAERGFSFRFEARHENEPASIPDCRRHPEQLRDFRHRKNPENLWGGGKQQKNRPDDRKGPGDISYKHDNRPG